MKKMKFVSSSFFVMVIAILFFIDSFYAVRTNRQVSIGPAFIPQVITVALFILAAVNWFATAAKIKETGTTSGKMSKETLKALISSIIVFLFCILSFETLGFLISGLIFLTAEILVLAPDKLNRKEMIKTVCITGLITVITYLLFNYAFQVSLPNGFLG